jgi:hypothetical protein
MYIIYESIRLDDPRLQHVERYGDNWMYSVSYVAPEHQNNVDLNSLKAVILTDEVAKASRFSAVNMLAYDGHIKFRLMDGGANDLFPNHSLDDPSADPSKKTLYKLTDEDIANTTEFLKILMSLELANHYAGLTASQQLEYATKRQQVQAEIDSLQDILSAHRLLHNRFECECHNHQRTAEQLGSPMWDLSEPGLEIRVGLPRDTSDSDTIQDH